MSHQKKMSRGRNRQSGFTLTELLITLAIVAMLSGIVVITYSGDKAKATDLYAKLQQYGTAMSRVKLDVSCYPLVTGVLVQKALATAANSSCGTDMQANWRGPYVKGSSLNAANNILMTEIGDNAALSVARGSNINGSGNTRQWYLAVSGIATPVADQVMALCNNGYTDATNATYKRGQCVLGAPNAFTAPANDDGVQTVWMIFDERP